MATILQTDFAWADDAIERAIIEGAGHRLITGPSVPLDAAGIEALVAAHDPAAIMTCWAQVSAKAIAMPTELKVVARMGIGLDNIAVPAATARGAWVTNVPDYCVEEVSDHAVAMLLDWARGTVIYDREVKAGRWNPAGAKLRRIANLTVGIVGFGRIGQATAAKLKGFGVRLLAHSRTPRAMAGVTPMALDDLLGQSDVVILHLPLTPETHYLMNAAKFAACKPGAFLINVSRGPIVDTAALLTALESGRISGAGLDVVEGEPDPPRALRERSDVNVTPHIAFSSNESLLELRRRPAEEVVRILAGQKPLHPCNQPQGAV